MKAKFKVNQKVKVEHEKFPFEGVVEIVMQYEKPFSKEKGYDYAVRANDDKELYKCEESLITALN